MEIDLENINKSVEDVRTSLIKYNEEYTPTVQSSNNNIFIIKMKTVSNETHDEIIATLKWSLGSLEETRFITIWPSIGETMKKRAITALVVALIAIIFYVAFSFREVGKKLNPWKFWLAAILALMHDIIITLGLFSFLWLMFNIEIDLLFITALLTILGFSVNDTIVTFDRFRENFRHARPTETFLEIGEKSVNQTITRSINTSLSTLFPLVMLYLFWAGSIKIFVLALIFGIFIGTYSSICIATPLLVSWKKDNDED